MNVGPLWTAGYNTGFSAGAKEARDSMLAVLKDHTCSWEDSQDTAIDQLTCWCDWRSTPGDIQRSIEEWLAHVSEVLANREHPGAQGEKK